MDILLLNVVDPFSYQIIPDIGLMYLASSLREAGYRPGIIDCRKEGWDLAAFEERIRRGCPPVVGIKCHSNEVNRVRRMTEIIRQVHPDTIILIGGPHPSMDTEVAVLGIPSADYFFLGESERNLVRFMDWVKSGKAEPVPDEIRGIAFRKDKGVEVRESVFEDDLDRLGLPAWDLMSPRTYPDEAAGIFVPSFPAAPMMLSRGCPFNCAYCGCRFISGKRLRYRPLESILEEINLLERDYGVRTFTFVDDNFTWDRERAVELFEALARREPRITFTFPNGVRVDSFDEELLRLMERAGCYLLALGIESGVDETLKRMNKKQTTAMVRDAVNLIRRTTSIRVTGFFILGYPGETISDVKKTIKFAVNLPIHHPHFCLYIPIPGTPVTEELRAQGLLDGDAIDLETFTPDRVTLPLPGLSAKKLLRLHQYAYIRFYMKPWRIIHLMGQFKSPGHARLIWRRFVKLFR